MNKPVYIEDWCPRCDGEGQIDTYFMDDEYAGKEPCPKCNGTGREMRSDYDILEAVSTPQPNPEGEER